mmetsp:Transcript_17794/g.43005  ORF Transcript_17794/g.43005 Transcript_17794/m.43005 type:complete len:210 (+) Transcript_17794:1870-2499(+)
MPFCRVFMTTPVGPSGVSTIHEGGTSARISACSEAGTRVEGTATSAEFSTGWAAAAVNAAMTISSVRLMSAGQHATTEEGMGAPLAPKSAMCAHSEAASSFTSSRVSDWATISVANCSWSGAMKVCPHATDSIISVSMSWLDMRSPWAASWAQSERSAERHRCSSDCESPYLARRLISRTAVDAASSHPEASAIRSSAHTAHASRGESR